MRKVYGTSIHLLNDFLLFDIKQIARSSPILALLVFQMLYNVRGTENKLNTWAAACRFCTHPCIFMPHPKGKNICCHVLAMKDNSSSLIIVTLTWKQDNKCVEIIKTVQINLSQDQGNTRHDMEKRQGQVQCSVDVARNQFQNRQLVPVLTV